MRKEFQLPLQICVKVGIEINIFNLATKKVKKNDFIKNNVYIEILVKLSFY